MGVLLPSCTHVCIEVERTKGKRLLSQNQPGTWRLSSPRVSPLEFHNTWFARITHDIIVNYIVIKHHVLGRPNGSIVLLLYGFEAKLISHRDVYTAMTNRKRCDNIPWASEKIHITKRHFRLTPTIQGPFGDTSVAIHREIMEIWQPRRRRHEELS